LKDGSCRLYTSCRTEEPQISTRRS
jgi:hypothetical protein